MPFNRHSLTRLRWLAFIVFSVMLLQPLAVRAEATPEYKIEAVYLLNIVRFVNWPKNSFAAADSPLVIGVLGENPFDHELEKLFKGKLVGGRTVVVQWMATAADAKSCQVVFIPASEQANLRGHLETLRNAPVLTIGECAEFLDDGGVIRFFVEQNKIRFDINKAQADAEGVQLDSQLLGLAKAVRETAGRKEGN
jgi:hypothetical protein